MTNRTPAHQPRRRTIASRLARVVGPVAGLVLAASVVATPVLAASTPGARGTGSAPAAQAEVDRLRCADVWRKAATNPSVETYQAVGTCEIDRRLATIERLGTGIEDARALTDDHEAALQAILDDAAAGLRTLRAEIEADTTVADLRADIRSIFTDYRIYALVTRQVWLVVGVDAVDAAGAALDSTADDLATLIERAEADGQDVTEAKAHLGAMQDAIQQALGEVDGLAAKILPLTPADWNEGTAGPVLRDARQAIVDARGDLRTALAEARQVIHALAA